MILLLSYFFICRHFNFNSWKGTRHILFFSSDKCIRLSIVLLSIYPSILFCRSKQLSEYFFYIIFMFFVCFFSLKSCWFDPCQNAGHDARAGQADQGEAETVFRDCERAHHQHPAVLGHRGQAAVGPVRRRAESLWAPEPKGTETTTVTKCQWERFRHYQPHSEMFFVLFLWCFATFFGFPLTSRVCENHFQLCTNSELQWLVALAQYILNSSISRYQPVRETYRKRCDK